MLETRLKLLRTEQKLKQSQLGDMIGLSQQTISRIEGDGSLMSVDALVRLANYFGVTSDYILGLSDQRRMSDRPDWRTAELEKYYHLCQLFRDLSERDRELLLGLGRSMRDLPQKGKKES